ncbi:Purine catabolism regulatory protein-like family protein [Actinopolyspora alba]|uniref:Purine catabolism regulatory protein-like family protein n=1 Tax=Actinopolyspora alba TaxID=673379 RepID=A0A1I2BU88_9ACTN|nr:PucR family transcriptional regulator [Actinopolyspora alba]SFE59488.1 Purine catabolism regulatory protein-like family protein [Actinopolyspora alba]
MLLGDLLDDSRLGLTLLTGGDRLDRVVRGVYVTDLIDPRRYLQGGELVLSGLVWHRHSTDSEEFAAALSDAGVAALVAGTARLGRAPADLVRACARHGVPLFELSVNVSFNTLFEHVLGAVRNERTSGRDLVTDVAAGADLPRVLAAAASKLGSDCWVCSAVGATVAEHGELSVPDRRTLVREFLRAERLPRTVATERGDAYVLWPVSSGTESRAARWFLVLPAEEEQRDTTRESVTNELATAVALLRSRLDEGRQVSGGPVGTALRALLEGSAGSREVAGRLAEAGLSGEGTLCVVALSMNGSSEAAADVLREIAAATGLPSVTAPVETGALAVFGERAGGPVELAGLAGWLRGTLADLEHGPTWLGVSVGVSDLADPSGLRGAVEEARYTRRLAEQRDGRCDIATAADLVSQQVLLSAVPDELRHSYRQRLLGGLLAYDRDHQSDLVHTLRTFLECSGSWSRCAQRLHVHVNTLRYRVRRVEEITGRDLGDFPTRVDFYLALQING